MKQPIQKFLAVFSLFGFTLGSSAFAQILPKNDFHLMDDPTQSANITEAQFHDIANSVVEQFKPLAAAHGATLTVNADWNDSTVNAYAEENGNDWTVNFFGGLARRPEITPDGFYLVVCHELGHHFGGFAFYSDTDWAAAEGEADYFAAEACAKKIWSNASEENAKSRDAVAPVVKQRCDANFTETKEQDLCYRTSSAALALANLLAAVGSDPAASYDTPDPAQVDTTTPEHPHAQCRLDTMFSGASCSAPFDFSVIPGRNNPSGQTSADAEKAASTSSCMPVSGFKDGFRPRCWFKPNL